MIGIFEIAFGYIIGRFVYELIFNTHVVSHKGD